MDKKTFTALFILLSTLANLLLNLAVIVALCVISCTVLGKVLHVHDGTVYALALLICFIAGLFISFIIYTRVSNKIIIKYKLEQKFDERWRGRAGEGFRRRKNTASEQSYTFTETTDASKVKTNIPDSLKPTQEEIEQAKKWGDEN